MPNHRPATAADAVVKNGQIKIGTCYDPNSVGINQNSEQAKEFLNSLPKRPLSNAAPPTKENIMKLNSAFATCSARFFKAYTDQYGMGSVAVTSAFRDGTPGTASDGSGRSANQQAGGAGASNHTRGIAMDVNAVPENTYPRLWKFASDNPQFGVCFPFQDGRTGSIYDRPHIILAGTGGSEGSLCARQGVARACSGTNFDPNEIQKTNPSTPTSQLSTAIRTALGIQPQVQPQIPMQAYQIPQLPTQQQQIQGAFQTPSIVPIGTPQVTPIPISEVLSPSNISTQLNMNNPKASSSTSTIDLLNAFLHPFSATSTEIGTSTTPVTLLFGTMTDIALVNNATSATSTATFNASGTIVSMQSVNAQQTFTSSDMQYTGTSVNTQTTLTWRILENMKQVLLKALELLKPFRNKQVIPTGDGSA